MVTTKERTDLRKELVGQGYSWEHIDEWQPKVTLYWHTEKVTPSGDVVSPVGTAVKGLPGNPDSGRAGSGCSRFLPTTPVSVVGVRPVVLMSNLAKAR